MKSRNRTQAAKAFLAETAVAKARGELIEKQWAFASLSYLLVCCRQRMLQSPTAIVRQLVIAGLVDSEKEHATSELLRREVHALLTELADLPEKVTNPDWLRTLEAEQAAGERRQTPEQVKAEEERTSRRREKKTASQRRLREQG